MDSENLRARKALRGNLAPPTFNPMLLEWKLKPREGRWPAQGEQAMAHRLSRVREWSSTCPVQPPLAPTHRLKAGSAWPLSGAWPGRERVVAAFMGTLPPLKAPVPGLEGSGLA